MNLILILALFLFVGCSSMDSCPDYEHDPIKDCPTCPSLDEEFELGGDLQIRCLDFHNKSHKGNYKKALVQVKDGEIYFKGMPMFYCIMNQPISRKIK